MRFLLGELDRILPELTEDDSPQIWHRLHRMSRLVVAHNTPPAGTPS
ncbi:hypothetical protein OG689_37585 [Kitasatospora sp. NBC_00240]|nr:hypothetical protein [Kitasatospora sp. NBC_00240]MCX5214909.1 hypothetical protein [Kitasatospora sp. NBC_00240]